MKGSYFTFLDFTYYQIVGWQLESFVLAPNFWLKISSYNRTIVRKKETSTWSWLYNKLISVTIKLSVDNLKPSCWYQISDSKFRCTTVQSYDRKKLVHGLSFTKIDFTYHQIISWQFESFVLVPNFRFKLWVPHNDSGDVVSSAFRI